MFVSLLIRLGEIMPVTLLYCERPPCHTQPFHVWHVLRIALPQRLDVRGNCSDAVS